MIIKVGHADPATGNPVALDVLDADGNVTRTIVIQPHQFEIIESSGLVLREVSMVVVQERERQAKVEAEAREKEAAEKAKVDSEANAKAVRDEAARTRPKQPEPKPLAETQPRPTEMVRSPEPTHSPEF